MGEELVEEANEGSSMKAEIERRQSNTEQVVAYFRQHEGAWIDTRTLEQVGGRNAWRTRVSDARKVFTAEGGELVNRQERILTFDEATGHLTQVEAVISEYRYRPSVQRAADVPPPDQMRMEFR